MTTDVETADTEYEADDASMLGMSDDEISNMDMSFLDDATDSEAATEEVPDATDETTAAEAADDESTDADLPGESTDPADSEDPEAEDPDNVADADKETEDEDKAEDKKKEESDEAPDVDYKAEYERLMAPFKANGKDMQAKSIDEVRQLMQMGANYNKKMAGLKPNLKTLKMLENNELLDEQKLSYLIDLDKKNPEAIAKLVKDSGIDPLEMNVDEAKDYQPKPYTVDDRQLALDEVLDGLQESETYNQLTDVVSNKWDQSSKQMVADNPQVLNVINDHMASGVYDVINAEVERERTFGRLNGLSDIEAYRQVGDAIHARGGFNHLAQGADDKQPAQEGATPSAKTQKPADPKVKEKKRAASPPKATPPSQAPADFNPLSMSDEEFENSINQNLL